MGWKTLVESDAAICCGRPRVKGTRITVKLLLGLKAAEWPEDEIFDRYPNLGKEHLLAVFAFAQTLTDEKKHMRLSRVN